MRPNGRFLYLANRATAMTDFQGKRVFAGGENSIAVYSINQETGEPALIQNIDTRGVHPRTFAIDPSGRILVDGVALTDYTVLARMPASDLQSIEVLSPMDATTLYGTNYVGGVIRIHTRTGS